MPLNTNEIIKTSQELHAAQERVRELETKLQALVMPLGRVPIGPNGEASTQLGGLLATDKHLSHLSTGDRIKVYLESEPKKDFRFQEIHSFVEGSQNYIRSLLAKMIKGKIIESRGWGLYGAISDPN